jgi:ribosome-associated protein
VTDRQTHPASDAGPAEAVSVDAAAEAERASRGERRVRPGLPARQPGTPRRRRAGADVDEGVPAIDPGEPDPEALAMAHRIVDLAADKKASDIILLDVRAQTTVTDYFVICSGGSERQLDAIVSGVVEGMKAEGVLPIGREGGPSSHWSLLDYGAAILHVMAPPEREYYQLEKLWADATLMLHVQ